VYDLFFLFCWAMAERDYFEIFRSQAAIPVIKIPAELGDGLEACQAYFIVYTIITCLWVFLLLRRNPRAA